MYASTASALAVAAVEEAEARRAQSWRKYMSARPSAPSQTNPFDVQRVLERAQSVNPFSRSTRNVTDMMLLTKHAPALAKDLEEKAKRDDD